VYGSAPRCWQPWLGSVLGGLVLACAPVAAPPEEDPLLETVEVRSPADAGIRIEDDPRAAAALPAMAGVLPGDAPQDLAIYVPSSLIDFGAAGPGTRFILLTTPDREARVRETVFRDFARLGWRRIPSSSEGSFVELEKGTRRLRVEVARAGFDTTIRIEYPLTDR
jgi:hypothetical protein